MFSFNQTLIIYCEEAHLPWLMLNRNYQIKYVWYESRQGKNHHEFNILYHTSYICSFLWYLLAHFWRQKALGKNIFLTIRCNCTNLQKKSIYFFYKSKGKKSSKYFSKKNSVSISMHVLCLKARLKWLFDVFLFKSCIAFVRWNLKNMLCEQKNQNIVKSVLGLGRSLTFATRSVKLFYNLF